MADTTIKLSGTYDSIEAYQILEDCRSIKTDVETAETTATNAATAAQGYANSASTYAGNASTYAGNASTYADNANASADDAAAYAANASTSETNASTSATNAHNSEIAAASSESNASASETNAAASAAAAALAITPTGSVLAFAGSTSPAGWLLCDGSAVSRETYADLFAVIGTTYGSGNGSTTFNLPDLADKFIQGNSTSGTVKAAGLPNITGSFKIRGWVTAGGTEGSPVNDFVGALQIGSNGATSGSLGAGNSQAAYRTITLNASNSSAIYGNSNTVQPPAVTMRYIIKY